MLQVALHRSCFEPYLMVSMSTPLASGMGFEIVHHLPTSFGDRVAVPADRHIGKSGKNISCISLTRTRHCPEQRLILTIYKRR